MKTLFARTLNVNGLQKYKELSNGVTWFLGFVVLLYTGFRAPSYVQQLPISFQTTTPPKALPIEQLQAMFPDNSIPAQFSSLEYPVVTICSREESAQVSLNYCRYNTVAFVQDCGLSGIAPRIFDLGAFGNNRPCISINPATPVNITSPTDYMEVSVSIKGVSERDGIFAVVGNQNLNNIVQINYLNSFSASRGTISEVQLEKAWVMPISTPNQVQYYAHASTAKLGDGNKDIKIQLRYPLMEIIYKKEVMPLTRIGWMCEVGGFSMLLLFLHRASMWIVLLMLTRQDRFSEAYFKNKF